MCLIIINFQLFAYLHLHILDISAVFFLASFTNCLFCQYSQIHSVLVKRSKERKRERESLLLLIICPFQPPSIVTDEVCTACDFNRPGKTCLRKLEWVWRGEIFMAKKRYCS